MSIQIKRLMSLLLAVLMILTIPISAFATSAEAGTETEPDSTEPETVPESTDPENTESTESTESVEDTESTESTECTESTESTESTEPSEPEETEVTEPAETLSPEHQRILDELPEAIKGDDPDHPYPYGLPVDNLFPEEIMLFAMARASMEAIPDEMYDNAILRALEYTGFDVQWLKDNGYLYVRQYVSSNLKTNAPDVLSGIGYDDYSPFVNGDETVADSSTISGKAPNMAKFREQGFVCGSFVSYFINNYLPNIEGVNTTHIHEAIKATTMNNGSYSTASVWAWETGLKNLSNKAGSGVTRYTDAATAYANLVPGDVIIFSDSDGDLAHAAIYAGEYYLYSKSGSNGGLAHFIIHVGNSRGPEISTAEFMASAGAKSSTPSAWYHLDVNDEVESTGWIEVYKKDPSGNALSGAYFAAVNNATSDTFVIGPTNTNGYVKSGELPLGVYTVTETVFPDGYESSGTSSWTATLTKDTPNMTFTINAVNQKITGSLKIQKATNTGKSLSGWSFGVYTDAACTKPISGSPFKTGSDGSVTVTGLVPGTYYVKELNGNDAYWVVDGTVKTVKVEASKTKTVTVTNTHYGYAQILKSTNTGKNLGGWKFNIYTDAACTKIVDGSPFITDDEGKISVKLLPGTYYVREVDESAQHPEWTYDTETRSVTVVAGSTKSVTFTNNQKTYVKIIKTTNTGKNLSGWKFNIYTDAACTKLVSGSPFTSGADGTITTQLAPGTYFIEECNNPSDYPDWDLDDGCHIVTLNAGETASVTFENIHYGYAQIVKQTNTGTNLAGWKFNIYTDEACTKLVDGSPFTTGETGVITTRLLPGDYYIREVDESSTYPEWTFDTAVKKVSVVAGDTKSVTFTNTQSGWAKLIKAMPDGGSVAGWTFEVYRVSDNVLIGTYVSGEDGTILTDALLPGEYQVKEIIPEDSLYVCESINPQTVTIVGGQTAEVTFTNRIKPGEIAIQKVNEKGEPLEGAQFRLEWSADGTTWNVITYSDSQYVTEGTCTSLGLNNGTLVTDESGLATFTGLHPERLYRLTEIKAPDGYQLLTKPAYEGGLNIESELIVTIKVTNFPVYELPKTGSNSLMLMPLFGLVALTACAAWIVTTTYRRKKA